MRINLLFFLVWAICSCSGGSYKEIVVPELSDDFYLEALSEINKKVRKDSENLNLVQQKIFYCERLGWPEGCVGGLDQYRSLKGMSNQLADQYLAYYLANGQMQSIVDLIARWDEEYNLSKKFRKPLIQGLVEAGDHSQSVQHIRQLLREETPSEELFSFVSQQFLQMEDSLMAAFYLGKLSKIDSTNQLMFQYGKILYTLGYPAKGNRTLDAFYFSQPKDLTLALDLAKFYEDNAARIRARRVIRPFAGQDTLAFYISDLYKRDFLWDSALMYLDTVLTKDQSSIRAWKKKGSIYESRGWLSASLSTFEKAQKLDSSDTSIAARISLIRRKIAYLQRQKFEESKVPLLQIESKKIEN